MIFTKMHGTGNDFIIVEDLDKIYSGNECEIAKKACDRHFGIGADGIIFLRSGDKANYYMNIFNSDGSEASMCGNGIRCLARYIHDQGFENEKNFEIETMDGIKKVHVIENNMIKINMGKPITKGSEVAYTDEELIKDKKVSVNGNEYSLNSIWLGVPHTVVFTDGNYEAIDGSAIENLDFFKNKTNVNFVKVISENEIDVETWERGAGLTMACGTGSCASVYLSNLFGYTSKNVIVNVPGGKLFIEISDDGIYMSGSAVEVFKGEISLDKNIEDKNI